MVELGNKNGNSDHPHSPSYLNHFLGINDANKTTRKMPQNKSSRMEDFYLMGDVLPDSH